MDARIVSSIHPPSFLLSAARWSWSLSRSHYCLHWRHCDFIVYLSMTIMTRRSAARASLWELFWAFSSITYQATRHKTRQYTSTTLVQVMYDRCMVVAGRDASKGPTEETFTCGPVLRIGSSESRSNASKNNLLLQSFFPVARLGSE